MTAAQALHLKIGADARHEPFRTAARVLFFHCKYIPDRNIHNIPNFTSG
jgi:hypothetical protein